MTMGAHSTVQVAGTRDKMLLSTRIQVKCLCVSSLNSAASPLLSEIASGHLIGYQQPRWSYEAEPTSLFLASLAALSEGLIWVPLTRCALNHTTSIHRVRMAAAVAASTLVPRQLWSRWQQYPVSVSTGPASCNTQAWA